MKSFEEHLRGAKAHNREDKIWLVTCFSGKMAKLCAKYGFPDDEDLQMHISSRRQKKLTTFFPLETFTTKQRYSSVLHIKVIYSSKPS